MPIHLLAEPDAIEFLRFWMERRGAAKLPSWNGDIGQFPERQLANLAVTERRPHSVFRHVGDELLRRWGGLRTGVDIYGEVIRGAHGRYLRSLGDDVMRWRGPVFSAACYRARPEDEPFVVVRIYAPFAEPGSGEPRFIAGLHVVPPMQDAAVDLRGVALEQELDRRFIADPGAVIARIAASGGEGGSARDLDRALDALSGSALVMLPPTPPRRSAPPRRATPARGDQVFLPRMIVVIRGR